MKFGYEYVVNDFDMCVLMKDERMALELHMVEHFSSFERRVQPTSTRKTLNTKIWRGHPWTSLYIEKSMGHHM